MPYHDGLTANMRAAMLALRQGHLDYTQGGFAGRAGYFPTRTVTALERRYFATVTGRGRDRRAALTDDGRPIADMLAKRL